jgi:tetratricopeptide (TPR) repeat protein
MAIKHKPDHAGAYFNRGNAYSYLGIYQKAIDDYTMAIKYRPDDAGAYFNRGHVYDVTGNSELAKRDYAKAIELNPELKHKQIQKF